MKIKMSSLLYMNNSNPENDKKSLDYKDIKLNFGKHKGKKLDEILVMENGKEYLKWLYHAMRKDEKKKSPTILAIMKYIETI